MKTMISRYVRVVLGAALYALGFNFFLRPFALVTGGVTGISAVVNYLLGFPTGVLTILINIPIFIWGGYRLGWRFLRDSAVGMIALSLLIDLFELFAVPVTQEPLLAALYGGVFCGTGLGIVFGAGATTGGTDIVARVLRLHFPFINIGQLMLILDGVILAVYAILFRQLDRALMSVLCIFVSSKVMDEVLYGLHYGKLAFIISDEYARISREITERMDRGVTVLDGKGAYTGSERPVLMCAIKKRQIGMLKRICREVDEKAFVIITDTKEVLGSGFDKNAEG